MLHISSNNVFSFTNFFLHAKKYSADAGDRKANPLSPFSGLWALEDHQRNLAQASFILSTGLSLEGYGGGYLMEFR